MFITKGNGFLELKGFFKYDHFAYIIHIPNQRQHFGGQRFKTILFYF
jgi:hypothetical protein